LRAVRNFLLKAGSCTRKDGGLFQLLLSPERVGVSLSTVFSNSSATVTPRASASLTILDCGFRIPCASRFDNIGLAMAESGGGKGTGRLLELLFVFLGCRCPCRLCFCTKSTDSFLVLVSCGIPSNSRIKFDALRNTWARGPVTRFLFSCPMLFVCLCLDLGPAVHMLGYCQWEEPPQ
jgi:hypothetical protein